MYVFFQLPEELLSVKGTLRTLDVSVNRLTVLPPSIGEFNNLRTLNLAQNKLSKLCGIVHVHVTVIDSSHTYQLELIIVCIA